MKEKKSNQSHFNTREVTGKTTHTDNTDMKHLTRCL